MSIYLFFSIEKLLSILFFYSPNLINKANYAINPSMIERSIVRKIEDAQNQGWSQRILTRFLYTGFRLLKACSLTDVTEKSWEVASTKEEGLWSSQVERLLTLGYHVELGISEDEYKSAMPTFQSQPSRFKNRFDFPVLVDPRVSLERQLALLKVKTDLTQAELVQLSLSEMQQEGDNPYQMWVNVGKVGSWKAIDECDYDERPLTAGQGLALLREMPHILIKRRERIILASSFLNTNDRTQTIQLFPEWQTPNRSPLQKDSDKPVLGKTYYWDNYNIPNITKGKQF